MWDVAPSCERQRAEKGELGTSCLRGSDENSFRENRSYVGENIQRAISKNTDTHSF